MRACVFVYVHRVGRLECIAATAAREDQLDSLIPLLLKEQHNRLRRARGGGDIGGVGGDDDNLSTP